jgi:hypothetical protein
MVQAVAGEDPPLLKSAKELLDPWKEKLVWLGEDSVAAAATIKEPLDYVYMETGHDYCKTFEDLQVYWPLVKPGGILAGAWVLHTCVAGGGWGEEERVAPGISCAIAIPLVTCMKQSIDGSGDMSKVGRQYSSGV